MSPKEEAAQSPEEARGILAKLGYDEEAVRRLLPPAGNGSGTVGSVEAPETAEVLDEVAGLIAKYVVLPSEHEAVAVALWVAHTWAFDGAHATPYLLVTSPERRSGKTRLLEVLELLVRSPWRIASASEAAMFRKISEHKPTPPLLAVSAKVRISRWWTSRSTARRCLPGSTPAGCRTPSWTVRFGWR